MRLTFQVYAWYIDRKKMKMKKQYTKKQIVESIKYWQSRLADLNESELSYDSLDDVYGDIVDNIIPQDRALNSKLMKLYQREFPDGKRSDDEFTEWTLDLIGPVFDRVMEKQLKSGIEQVLRIDSHASSIPVQCSRDSHVLQACLDFCKHGDLYIDIPRNIAVFYNDVESIVLFEKGTTLEQMLVELDLKRELRIENARAVN